MGNLIELVEYATRGSREDVVVLGGPVRSASVGVAALLMSTEIILTRLNLASAGSVQVFDRSLSITLIGQ